ncbi:MAG: 50S ribosomal protein L25 [Syntrophales bacterium]|nr:50S ribosomal protein L25 [Syntrophales bacterium]
MKTIGVEVYTRTDLGKQSARKLRGRGYMPAVFYGLGVEPVHIYLEADKFLKQLGKEKAEGTFIELEVLGGDGKASKKLSVLKDLQIDTLKRRLVHADFYEIKMDREVTVDLAIHFTGSPQGVEDGGEVQQLKREVKVSGLPGALPGSIELDISGMNIGDTLKVGDISLGDNVRIMDGEDVALVTVAAMRVTAEEEVVEEAASDEGAPDETPDDAREEGSE